MLSLQPFLDSLLSNLQEHPISKEQLDIIVSKTLDESQSHSSTENRKSQWEYLLKNEIFKLAVAEGKALKENKEGNVQYYDELQIMLDLVLTFTEHEACEQTFPFIILQDLLEMQTINSCSHIFSWIEVRSSRLTEGMVPQKGKALILLRTLNDLLRRLSKSGSTTVFCGRILTFLSGVFPLGERSGVNLRGEYGPTWEDVAYPKQDVHKDVQMLEQSSQDDTMQIDSTRTMGPPAPQTPADKKEDFYNTFWHLQLPFSKPPLFTNKDTFPGFKEAINKILPVIKEATAKDRAMMGSRVGAGSGSHKRKRDPEGEETNANEYFFAKFLTSPDLLDLEVASPFFLSSYNIAANTYVKKIADTHFRRQFLFQLLILLHHLLTFTKNAKATWATPRNRSLQMDFVLEPEDAQWVQETLSKAMEELKQTTPNGRAFAETVQTILEREKNWVKWKNELCATFDKATWFTTIEGEKTGLFRATRERRDQMQKPREDWPHMLGTEPLTEIWQMGYRGLDDLENPFQPGDVKDFVKHINQEDRRIEMRKQALARITERVKPTVSQPIEDKPEMAMSVDPQVVPVNPPTPSPAPPSVGAASPLHPSLPPRPTTQSASTQNVPGPTTTPVSDPVQAPTSAPAPILTPAPASVAPALAPSPTPAAPIPSAPMKKPEPLDPQIAKLEEDKQRWTWLALRTARDQHLQHFGKIGTGDVKLLMQEIEKEKQEPIAERERLHKAEDTASTVDDNNSSKISVLESDSQPPAASPSTQKAEMDVKMESQP